MPIRVSGVILAAALAASGQSLRDLAKSKGVYFGEAGAVLFLNEGDYPTVLAREFNQLEPENDTKFGPIHPAPETYAWQRADALVEFGAKHGMRMRGHTLVWHNQNPAWLTKGSFTPVQLNGILESHIAAVMRHFRGKMFGWDVVNEAFNDDGTMRSTIWYDKPGIGLQGTGYIEQAFKWARAADPDAKLFYNDYNNEAICAKSDAMYAMVKDFKARGVPIDGVGLQMHLTLKPNLDTYEANIERFGKLGMIVEITELDVRVPVDASGKADPADLVKQAEIYERVVRGCLKFSACKAIQVWGVTDKHSWIPGVFKGTGEALIFDKAYQPKPAYTAVRKAFEPAQ